MDVDTMKLLMEHSIMRSSFKVFCGYQKKIREKTRYDLKFDFTGLEAALRECEQFLRARNKMTM